MRTFAENILLAVEILFASTALSLQAHAQGGVPLWTNRYNGPGNGNDQPYAIAADARGSVFVTGSWLPGGGGYAYATIKYSGGGVPLWTNAFGGTAMALDGSGNVLVTSGYSTIKYSSEGVALWSNVFYGSAAAIAVDASGNVIATGFYWSSSGARVYSTVEYSSAGVPLWTNIYTGDSNYDAIANAVGVDNSGNIFVTGGNPGAVGYATIAYSGAGVPLWTNTYKGPGNYDSATAIALDANGNVFVTGESMGSGTGFDYATVKYSPAGATLWSRRYNDPGNYDDVPSGMVMDGNGNVIVTGTSVTSYNGGSVYTTIKYSNAGAQLWINRYNGFNGNDSAHAVAVDSTGNVFVTGSSTSASGAYSDFATLAYSSTGVSFWTNRYNGPGHGADGANAIAVDGSGNVIVTGGSLGSGTSYDYATIKYSSSVPQPILPTQLTILPDGGGGYIISAQGNPNFSCQLQRASILTGPWSTSVSQTADSSGLVQFHDFFPPPGRAFYRTVQ